MPKAVTPKPARTEVFFAVTLFVGAALLFAVEPMFAKMVLPLLGGAGGLEYLPGVLSGDAPGGISLCAPFPNVAGTAAAGRLAPAVARCALGSPADRSGQRLAAAARRVSGPLAVDAVVGLGGFALSGGLGHRTDVAGMVQSNGWSGRPRPLFPLRRQQSGELAGLAELSVADRIAMDPQRAGMGVGGRLRSVDAADRRLCGAVVAVAAGRHGGTAEWRRRSREATGCRTPEPATATAMVGAVAGSFQLVVGRNDLHFHRSRRDTLVVGASAGAIPVDVRVGLRPAIDSSSSPDDSGAAVLARGGGRGVGVASQSVDASRVARIASASGVFRHCHGVPWSACRRPSGRKSLDRVLLVDVVGWRSGWTAERPGRPLGLFRRAWNTH